MSAPNETIRDGICRAAFRRLLSAGEATDIAALARDLGRPAAEVAAAVDDMSRQGRLLLDDQGRVAVSTTREY